MKKIMIGSVALIATIGLLIAVLELTSSYKDSVTINTKAPLQTTKEIILNATPEKVWTIMSKIDEWPSGTKTYCRQSWKVHSSRAVHLIGNLED